MELKLPAYDKLQKILNKTLLKWPPSQMHGLICGMLCSPQLYGNQWQRIIFGEGNIPQASLKLLNQLVDTTTKQLASFSFEFQLFLPNEQALAERVEALALWCQGFLSGMKLVHVDEQAEMSEDAQEAKKDLIEIANMSEEAIADSNEEESAYEELIEFVRVAVLVIYQETHLRTMSWGTSSPKSLH